MGGGQKQAPPPLLKILDVGFLVGVVPLEALLSKFHEDFLSGTAWRSMGFDSYVLATVHTFACENTLGALLVRVIKLGVIDTPREYPILLDDIAEKCLFLPLS